nr:alpha/beta hydrolase [uncultured Mitsuokella sp.]
MMVKMAMTTVMAGGIMMMGQSAMAAPAQPQVPSRGYANVPMQMDILQPKTKEKKPAILFVTGGGFINANKDNGIQLRMHLTENGYVVGSINYRVAPTAKFPEPLEDVKAAIRYLKANAGARWHCRRQCRRLSDSHGRYDERHDDVRQGRESPGHERCQGCCRPLRPHASWC